MRTPFGHASSCGAARCDCGHWLGDTYPASATSPVVWLPAPGIASNDATVMAAASAAVHRMGLRGRVVLTKRQSAPLVSQPCGSPPSYDASAALRKRARSRVGDGMIEPEDNLKFVRSGVSRDHRVDSALVVDEIVRQGAHEVMERRQRPLSRSGEGVVECADRCDHQQHPCQQCELAQSSATARPSAVSS